MNVRIVMRIVCPNRRAQTRLPDTRPLVAINGRLADECGADWNIIKYCLVCASVKASRKERTDFALQSQRISAHGAACVRLIGLQLLLIQQKSHYYRSCLPIPMRPHCANVQRTLIGGCYCTLYLYIKRREIE